MLDVQFVQINPVTGNRQLIDAANDVSLCVERLGGIEKAASFLGVEEIEVHHWIDSHYVPTRYAEAIIRRLGRWDLATLQRPSIGNIRCAG
ncbi:MAG: hypothetical protein Q7T98_04900 [Polaromonas sp.]|nr:hypothetical protein [Polaromonas sp.]